MSDLEKKIEEENIAEIENQMARLGFFSQNGLTSQAERLNQLESALYGLINTLLERGAVDADKLKEITFKVREDMIRKGEDHKVGIMITDVENTNPVDETIPMVNCEERLHICKAVCCKLKFALTRDEVEGGKIKWDLGIPYQIRQRKDGYCSHNQGAEHSCSIYNDRPFVCKRFNCTNDPRIWTDFEKMELNDAWIKENIAPKKVVFMQ